MTPRDDAVLPATRALSIFIVPFLVVAFAVLYGFPGDTETLFAWTINPPMTPMTLGAVYLGGAWFFVRAARATEWHTVKMGFVAVGTFASAMAVATVLHWDRFNHDHVAFWLWAGLYFTTPFLVWGVWAANRRREAEPGPEEVDRLPRGARAVIAATAAAAVVAGAYLFLLPTEAAGGWPWALTPLTARVLGAILLLGTAGLGVLADPRWSSARIMLQIQVVMMSLILVAAIRARDDFDGSKPLGWLLLAGFVAALAGGAGLARAMSSGPDRRPTSSHERSQR
jgi:hypothetical protein